MTESPEKEPPRSLASRILNLVTEVRRGEAGTALILLVAIFVLLLSYYVLKTVREPLVLSSAQQDLQLVRNTGLPQWLKTILMDSEGEQIKAVATGCQAFVLLGFVPAYSWVASRVSRSRLIASVTIFFIVCIQLFFVLRLLGVPMLGFFFFIWVGVFSVATIAQFWSFGNDIYSEEQGKRLFPLVGIGATAGGGVGSKIASALYDYLAPESLDHADAFQRSVHGSGLDPSFILLQIPAFMLVLFMIAMVWVSRREGVAGQKTKETEAKMDRRGGFALVLKSPYLRLIAVVILVLNLVNTTGEFLLAGLVRTAADAAHAADPGVDKGAFIGEFYGDYFLYVTIGAFLLQAFVVSRIARYLGLRGVLLALPLVAFGTYSLFAVGVGVLGIFVLRWAKSAENMTDYSIMNTGKAMVWLPTSRGAKYKGKQAVDTLMVRIGDVISATMFLVGSAALSMGLRSFALVNLALVVLWLLATFLLLRQNRRIEEDPKTDPVATGAS